MAAETSSGNPVQDIQPRLKCDLAVLKEVQWKLSIGIKYLVYNWLHCMASVKVKITTKAKKKEICGKLTVKLMTRKTVFNFFLIFTTQMDNKDSLLKMAGPHRG